MGQTSVAKQYKFTKIQGYVNNKLVYEYPKTVCPIEIASCKVVGQQVVITVKVNKLDNYVFYANDKPFDIRFLSPGTHTLRYPLSKFPRGSVTISVRRAGFI